MTFVWLVSIRNKSENSTDQTTIPNMNICGMVDSVNILFRNLNNALSESMETTKKNSNV